MASTKFSVGQINLTGYLRIIARETSNLAAIVHDEVFGPDLQTTENIVISNLNPVEHQFEFYDTPTPLDLGDFIAEYVIDVGLINQAAIIKYEFTVDGGDTDNPDPADGTKDWNQTELAGIPAEQLIVSERALGIRSFLKGEIEVLDTGGFKLPDAGSEVFVSGDFWVVLYLKTVTIKDPVNITRGKYATVISFDDDVTIDDTHYDALLLAAGPDTDILTLNFPELDTIPNGTAFTVSTHSGLQRYVAVQLSSGDVAKVLGGSDNIFWIGLTETVEIIVQAGVMYISKWDGDFNRVGDIVKSNVQPKNTLAETGAWYNFDDYPRFYYWYVANIDPAQLSAFSGSTVTDRTKFAIDSPNTRFWLPDTGGYVERNVDPNGDIDTRRTSSPNLRYSGTIQADSVGSVSGTLAGKTIALSGGNGGTPNADVLDSNIVAPFNGGAKDITISITGASETSMKNVAVNSWRKI